MTPTAVGGDPLRAAAEPPKQIVVLGAGSWVKDRYAPALRPYCEDGRCGLFVVYDTDFAGDADAYNERTRENVREFTSWGATCLDLASPETHDKLAGIAPHTVFVVTPDETHCVAVSEWLGRAANIIVEKPFDVDAERIRRLRTRIDGSSTKVWGFDHYLVRANQFVRMREYLGVDDFLEEKVTSFTFHMFEASDRGMRERAPSLQQGMILDMAIHAQAMLLPFVGAGGVRLDGVHAGIYDGDKARGIAPGRSIMRSGMETAAEVRFRFDTVYGTEARGVVRVGKCVGARDDKRTWVVGGERGDRTVCLDLGSQIVDFEGGGVSGPVTSLFARPVALLVREVMEGRSADSLALFSPEVAQEMVSRTAAWRRPIVDFVEGGGELATYPACTPFEAFRERLTPL